MPLKRRKVVHLLACLGLWPFAKSGAAEIEQAQTPSDAKLPSDLSLPAERVLGIGGLFFRAHDPEALAEWYRRHLGITPTPTSQGGAVWQTQAGATVFAPFSETSKYFGDQHQVWMVNFRVGDLDRMAAQLRTAGITVNVDPQKYPNGRFARIHDPEGNPLELWEPARQ